MSSEISPLDGMQNKYALSGKKKKKRCLTEFKVNFTIEIYMTTYKDQMHHIVDSTTLNTYIQAVNVNSPSTGITSSLCDDKGQEVPTPRLHIYYIDKNTVTTYM